MAGIHQPTHQRSGRWPLLFERGHLHQLRGLTRICCDIVNDPASPSDETWSVLSRPCMLPLTHLGDSCVLLEHTPPVFSRHPCTCRHCAVWRQAPESENVARRCRPSENRQDKPKILAHRQVQTRTHHQHQHDLREEGNKNGRIHGNARGVCCPTRSPKPERTVGRLGLVPRYMEHVQRRKGVSVRRLPFTVWALCLAWLPNIFQAAQHIDSTQANNDY